MFDIEKIFEFSRQKYEFVISKYNFGNIWPCKKTNEETLLIIFKHCNVSGYVYNGLHLRGPRTPRREGRGTQFSNYVRHTRFAPSKTAEGNSFQPNFDFESDFNTIKESLKSGNEGDVYQTAYVTPTPQATYEEPAAYQEPAQVYQEPQVEYEQPAQVYQEPEPAYEEPATTTTYAPPTHSDKYRYACLHGHFYVVKTFENRTTRCPNKV